MNMSPFYNSASSLFMIAIHSCIVASSTVEPTSVLSLFVILFEILHFSSMVCMLVFLNALCFSRNDKCQTHAINDTAYMLFSDVGYSYTEKFILDSHTK